MNKGLLLTTTIFLLILSTSYYWEGKLGILTIPVFIFLVIIYLVLGVMIIVQLYHLIREKFTIKTRLLNFSILLVVLTLTFSKPYVFLKNLFLMEYVDIENDNVLVAARLSETKKNKTFILDNNFTFKEKNAIYSLSEMKGTYKITNDTIYFENVRKGKQEDIQYEFGVIEELKFYTEHKYGLKLYRNKADTIGFQYSVLRNDLNVEPLIKSNR